MLRSVCRRGSRGCRGGRGTSRWPVAAGGGAAVVAESHREALGLGVQASSAAEVEGLGLAAEDGGDDPGGTGEAAGLGGGEVAAGVQGADPGRIEVGQELFEGHGDHDGGAAAAGLRQGLAGDGLDELAERLPVAHVGGQVLVDVGGGVSGPVRSGPSASCPVPGRGRTGSGTVRGRCRRVLPHAEASPAARPVLPGRPAPWPRRPRPGRGRSPRTACGPAPPAPWRRSARRGRPGVARPRGALVGVDRELTAARQPVERRSRSRWPARRSRHRCPTRLRARRTARVLGRA